MRLLITGRGLGKTTQALEWVKEKPKSVLVVHSRQEAERLLQQEQTARWSGREGLQDWQVCTVHDYLHGALRGRTTDRLAIDNLDLVLGHIFGSIGYATMTRPEQLYVYGPSD
jgi:DNA transposition AAA+ family ATPase